MYYCPDGWEYFKGNCYQAQPLNAAGINFAQANSNCKALGAKLTSIHSPEENAFITGINIGSLNKFIMILGLFNGVNNLTNADFWTGATTNTDGVISWTDNTTVNDAPTDLWKLNEPNGDGTCMTVFSIVMDMIDLQPPKSAEPILNGQWDDIACASTIDSQNRPIGVVCELSGNPFNSGVLVFSNKLKLLQHVILQMAGFILEAIAIK